MEVDYYCMIINNIKVLSLDYEDESLNDGQEGLDDDLEVGCGVCDANEQCVVAMAMLILDCE